MASRLNPYLSFKGNARQAMAFYQSVLGGDLHMNTFGDYGAADQPHSHQIMHAMLETPSGYTLMASDTPPGMEHNPGTSTSTSITISISGDDGDELRGYWEKLAAAGTVHVPLEKQVWGDEFGSLTDQFGIGWMVNIGQPR